MGVRNPEGYMDLVPYKSIANIDRGRKAEKRSAFRPLVYICSPFSGDIEGNKKKFIERLGKRFSIREIVFDR